ncbi:heavy metal translocating P-type ATPase [Chitinispirillales bacterium ANBcel5]|uniref:heavy metal translocating P-type ATPase n=1 Tax=Cellulosispirillum alkaliphilum TaxID=3039283 RepID=UPI002A570DC6|nr:heavy metal translocating P-type ATPase [Chitinispirillales bacterium ANBcel5]
MQGHSDQGHTNHESHRESHEGAHGDYHSGMVKEFRRRFWVALIITIPILLLSPMIQQFLGLREQLRFPGDQLVLFILSAFLYFYGGKPFLVGIVREVKTRDFGMMTLIALAITVAFVYSAAVTFGLPGEVLYWELATLITIMLLGHWLEMRSISGASRALESLVKLMPSVAHRIKNDGTVEDIRVDEIQSQDTVLVKPGEKIPVDGTVVEGESSVNEAMITGESTPVYKGKDGDVVGGSINGEGAIKVMVTRTGEQSYLSQMIKLVQQAQQGKSKTQLLANRAAVWLTAVALVGGAVTLVVWLILGVEFAFAIERTVTVMVIACPHALGLAIPLVIAVSTSISASRGLLIKKRPAFESSRSIQAVLFDKTGTLTEGKFGVSDIVSLDESFDRDKLLLWAASVEAHSEHPIAKAIVESAAQTLAVSEFRAIAGRGAQGMVEGKQVLAVSPAYVKEKGYDYQKGRVSKLLESGKTVIFVIVDEKVTGAIALMDIIREESKEAISRLKAMGIKTVMITGDNQKVAQWAAWEMGIDEYFAEVLPQEKVEKVKEVQGRGLFTAMVGDGINDAPALATADVGIAIGAGTEVAAETADVILVRNDPRDVVSILELARASYRKMVQNLFWATGYNVIAIPLAAGVLYNLGVILSPAMGAALMSISTIIVAVNAKILRVG